MVTINERTSHTGASSPKRVIEPRLAVAELALELLEVTVLPGMLDDCEPPPQRVIIRTAIDRLSPAIITTR
jgi:hypothetical protein